MKLDMSLTKGQKKALLITGVIVLGLLIVLVPIYCIRSYRIKKAERAIYIARKYSVQNEAFARGYYKEEYMPYKYDGESFLRLQMYLNAYHYRTGETCTADDIKKFLETSKNPDGSPRTFEDDTGPVGKYVKWHGNCDDYWDTYENNLNKILSKYKEKNPECSYYNIDELTIEQVNEICKYYGQDSKGNKVELGEEVDKYPYEKLKLE